MIIEFSILLAIVIGAVEVAKEFGLPTKFAPILSIGLAILLNLVIKYSGYETGELILTGIIAGLSACGLYSGT